MARDNKDYEDLLRNFDDSVSKNSSSQRNNGQRSGLNPNSVRSSSNDIFSNSDEQPQRRPQNPNSPFYRASQRELPTPKSTSRGNDAFKAAKGLGPKSKADLFLDELEEEENAKKNRRGLKSYRGEVYFSNPPREIKEEADYQRTKNTRGGKAPYGKNPNQKTSAPPVRGTQKRELIMKERAKKRRAEGILTTKEKLQKLAIYVLIVVVTSTILCIYGVRCINDVLAIEKLDRECEVTVSTGATDSEVVGLLKDNDLIRNELFCKLFVKFVNGSGEYVSGSYTLNSDWGLEKMLSTMQKGNNYSETITLTFPEGWTIDQIAEKLEANKVCTASSFIKTMESVDFASEYKFLAGQKDQELRFRKLEGYIYPDTYEFYIGENASSVVRRFLDNFESKWSADYQKQADKLGMTVDEIVTLASIIEKEAANQSQMSGVSSVLHNRLDKPGTFPKLECDSTEDYLKNTIKATLTSSTTDTQKYIAYRDLYDTYADDCKGLPVGAIANPGLSAIRAALYPDDTSYNYFRHDKKGKIYYATTFSEHTENGYKVAAISDED